jgi:hypothetical protein
MFWGRNAHSHSVSPNGPLSGHIDRWEEIAVDYVDGRLDDSTEAAVRAHLHGCPDCAERLESQKRSLESFRQASLVEAPTGLEDTVLSEILFPREPVQVHRPSLLDRLSRRAEFWWTGLRPWMPAAAAVVVVLAVIVAVGVIRQRDLSEGQRSADRVATTAVAGVAEMDAAAEDATLLTASTTAPLLGAAGTESTEDATGLDNGEYAISGAGLRPTGAHVEDRGAMVNSLASADGPAYFYFAVEGEGFPTTQQADTIAQRVTAETGLGLMNKTLSSGTRAFAAFVPREDAQAIVDLLLTIGASLDLTVSLSLEPGKAVSVWAESLLANKYAVAELDASPSESPDTTAWSYTTSTSPSTTEGTSSTTTVPLPDEAGTHVLVVILIGIQN